MITYNPIKGVGDFSNGFFVKIPIPSEETAILLTKKGQTGDVLLVYGKNNVTPNQIRKGKYDQKVEIDMTYHKVSFEVSSPSKDLIHQFEICITTDVKVINPIEIYLNGINDMAQFIKNSIMYRVSKGASSFVVQQFQELGEVLEKDLNQLHISSAIECKGFFVSVQPDKQVKEHLVRKENFYNAHELKEMAEKYGSGNWYDVATGELSVTEAQNKQMEFKNQQLKNNMENFSDMIDLFVKAQDAGMMDENQIKAYLEKMIPNLATPNNKQFKEGPEQIRGDKQRLEYPNAEELEEE